MQRIKTVKKLKEIIKTLKDEERTIGFVPTMGALHKGHISLIKRSVRENEVTLMSIFVNPRQFNNSNDLKTYPRNLQEDERLLKYEKVDYIFAPSVDEIYPEKETKSYDFGGLAKVMEGKYREGHFNGVAQVVSILLDLIPADRAYFGRKDYQQLVIINHLVEHYKPECDTQIVECNTVREKDGLAMSSRNAQLTKSERLAAPTIFDILSRYRNKIHTLSPQEIIDEVKEQINAHPLLKVEYFEIVNDKTLKPVDSIEHNKTSGCIAVHAGKVRLIDNISF
ncbi:MAG: pantoate--beta-alanine ligase [Bacteroidota bacterium]|nr:pantoate--beta-alanine ligase [Bacteroidota bacterium]